MAARASAHDVALELRKRLPTAGTKVVHKLLYYCQGHHLAAFDEPLFAETISAWDMGPVVGQLWYAEKQGQAGGGGAELDEAALNTIGYVVSRYGQLSGRDLENLTHSEPPWRIANEHRRPGTSTRIELDEIASYFRSSGDDDDEMAPHLDSDEVSRWLAGATPPTGAAVAVDSRDAVLARLRG